MPRNALIQFRRDTAANWTSLNPTLAAGELGVETDTGKFKIGTGSTAWASLSYAADASKITGTSLSSVPNIYADTSLSTGSNSTVIVGSGALSVYSSTNKVGISTLSPNYTLEVNGLAKAAGFSERWALGSFPSGTVNVDCLSYVNYHYGQSPAGNWTINIRGNSGTTFNNTVSIGDSVTITFVVYSSSGSATGYPSTFQIDGSTQTVRWQGGTAPSSAYTTTTNSYVYTIIKTGSSTYNVLGSHTKFGAA